MEKLIYEGKAKQLYSCDDQDAIIIKYKNTATAFNGEKKVDFEGKGKLNCSINNIMMALMEKNGVPTHTIETIDDITVKVKKVDIVMLEVIVRNIAAGSFSKRFGVEEGSPLQETIVEFCYKNDDLGDPMINERQIVALGLATYEELDTITKYTLKVNEIMQEFYMKAGLKLVDFKIEFGRYKGEIILADEISPDSCRLWDIKTNAKLDKDVFRRGIGDLISVYSEVLKRIQ